MGLCRFFKCVCGAGSRRQCGVFVALTRPRLLLGAGIVQWISCAGGWVVRAASLVTSVGCRIATSAGRVRSHWGPTPCVVLFVLIWAQGMGRRSIVVCLSLGCIVRWALGCIVFCRFRQTLACRTDFGGLHWASAVTVRLIAQPLCTPGPETCDWPLWVAHLGPFCSLSGSVVCWACLSHGQIVCPPGLAEACGYSCRCLAVLDPPIGAVGPCRSANYHCV